MGETNTDSIPHPPARREHSQREVDLALFECILYSSSFTKASRSLKEKCGIEVSAQTLRSWTRDKHRKRYAELHKRYEGEIERDIINRTRDFVSQVTDVEQMALDQVREALQAKNIHPRELPQILRNLTSSKTANIQKTILELSGRAAALNEGRQIEEVIKALEKRFPKAIAIDAEVVEE